MELTDVLFIFFVWEMGMIWVMFNIEAGNNVHIYYDSNKTRETCVHIGYFYTFLFTKLFTATQVSEDFQFRVSSSWSNLKHTALH